MNCSLLPKREQVLGRTDNLNLKKKPLAPPTAHKSIRSRFISPVLIVGLLFPKQAQCGQVGFDIICLLLGTEAN